MSLNVATELYIEEDMPESQAQINVVDDAKSVLKYMYRLEKWFCTGNLEIIPPSDKVYPFKNIAPDVAVFKVVVPPGEQVQLSSWNMDEPGRPAPVVAIEIGSKATWKDDLERKPAFYRLLGVKEYFVCAPQRLWRGVNTPLLGWRYGPTASEVIVPNERGWLWSNELDSWLGMDGAELHLYDREGNLRLNGEQAEAETRQLLESQAETARRLAEAQIKKVQEAAKKAQEATKKARAKTRQTAAQVKKEAQARSEAEQKLAELQRELDRYKKLNG